MRHGDSSVRDDHKDHHPSEPEVRPDDVTLLCDDECI